MATGPVVDQLAHEYGAAHLPVVFLEHDIDHPPGDRYNRWWAAHGSGSVTLPLIMVDSGNQFSNGYLGAPAYGTYKAMVDAALLRPPKAEIRASSRRAGSGVSVQITLTNLSGVTLSSVNGAEVHAILYEEHTPVDPNTDHITGRIVRAVVSTPVNPALPGGSTWTVVANTGELTSVVDWSRVHVVVLADYRPGGSSGAYDMLQASFATNSSVYLPLLRR